MRSPDIDILVVDDEESICAALKEIFEYESLTVDIAHDGDECLSKIETASYALVLLDINMKRVHGQETLLALREKAPNTKVIMISGNKEPETVANLMHLGAYHYFTKPFDLGALMGVVRTVIQDINPLKMNGQTKKVVKRRPSVKPDLPKIEGLNGTIIGDSPVMVHFKKQLEKIANTDFDVLILGENGTGKGLAANYIHKNSSRRNFKFLTLNCATIPDDLLATTLFGNTKSAFNNASDRVGYFEDADGGIVFLDEIGTVTLQNQARLLNVLQDREVTRIGSNKAQKVNVRVISATNENIVQNSRNKTFREDLYHRINRLNIVVPPLRERGEDIILLASYFNQKMALEGKLDMVFFDDGAKEQMLNYAWPGNVRELENVIVQAIVTADDAFVSADLMGKLLRN